MADSAPKVALLAGATLAVAAPAFAQDNATTVEDIVVTAQRRSERLQDVPISITALSSAALDRSGVTTTQDLARVTPGLSFPVNGGYIQPTIRGISSDAGAGTTGQPMISGGPRKSWTWTDRLRFHF